MIELKKDVQLEKHYFLKVSDKDTSLIYYELSLNVLQTPRH